MVKWNFMDGGFYIIFFNVIIRDLFNWKFGRNNGMYWMMIYDEKTIGIMCVAT